MKILVTGATGFVGQHVVRWLVNNGYTVTATGTSTEKAKAFDWFEKVKFIPCDYFSEDVDYYELFEQPDIVIHIAWKGLPNYMDQIHMENLYASSRLLLSFIKHHNVKIVGLGTDKEYGVVNGLLSENMPTNPNTVYGIAKDTLRRNVEILATQNKLSWNWIRLFFVYGDGQSPKSLLPQLETAILNGDAEFPMSGGEQLRDYLHIEQAAEYICKIALQNKVNGVVNCCSGDTISVRRLVENKIHEMNASIALKLGVYGYSPVEGMAFWGDDRLLREILDNHNKL